MLRAGRSWLTCVYLAVAAAFMPSVASAQFGFDEEAVTARAIPQKSTVRPGEQLAIAVIIDHAPGFHTWPNKPVLPDELSDFTPIPTQIAAAAEPAGAAMVGPVQWPEPHAVTVNYTGSPVELLSYEKTAVAYVPVSIDPGAAVGQITFQIDVSFQSCNDTMCLPPGGQSLTVTLEIVGAAAAGGEEPADPALFADFDPSVFARMLSGEAAPTDATGSQAGSGAAPALPAVVEFDVFGFKFSINSAGALGVTLLFLIAGLGGFVLNLTPCVLPVIPIKIIGLSQAAKDPSRCFFLGVVMSLGLVFFWLAIAVAIISIQGFAISSLFRMPAFSIFIGLFIAAMAVGMLGVFTVRLPQAVYMVNPSHDTARGSFLFGIMTGVLATPCVAPFMGTAVAWATTQSPFITLGTFFAIGIGMAMPYLLLSANPKWVDKVPRTGPASELVKQVMGLLMLAVAAFFVGTGLIGLVAQFPFLGKVLHWWTVAILLGVAAAWLIIRTFQISPSFAKRAVFTLVGIGLTAGGIAVAQGLTSLERKLYDAEVAVLLAAEQDPSAGARRLWAGYSPVAMERALDEGKVVVIDFTAEWCLICKTLKLTVLSRPEVEEVLRAEDVVTLTADLTNPNAPGWAMLNDLGERGIPLLAIFGPGLKEPIKSNAYTPEQVTQWIQQARGASPETIAKGRPQ